MNIDKHLESVRDGVQHAAALADDRTRQVAEQLGTALEPTIRLTLVQALAEAATEISARTAPTTVALRLDGDQPVFDVSTPGTDHLDDTEDDLGGEDDQLELDADDAATARVSLRIPQSLKDRVDQVAAAQGVSTNVWITQALTRVVIRQTWRGPGGRGRAFGPQADERQPGERPGPEVPPFGPDGGLPQGWPFGPRGHHGPRGRGRGGRRGGPGAAGDAGEDPGSGPGEHPGGPGEHRGRRHGGPGGPGEHHGGPGAGRHGTGPDPDQG